VSTLRLVIEFDTADLSPREVRSSFAQAIRDAIAQGRLRGDIDAAVAEELWRVAPDPERA
jgi:hypothetical protein